VLLAAALSLAAAPSPAVEPPPAFTTALHADHPLVGRIWRPATGEMLSPEALAGLLAATDMALLGERHDNPDHHALQAWMLRRMIEAGRRPAVAFEMMSSDQAPAIAAHLATAPRDAAGLGAALGWEKSGWPDWRLYSPIAQAAMDAGLPVVAANLPRETTRAISKGNPPEGLAARLGIDRPLPPALAADMVEELKSSHCNQLPESAVAPMMAVQRARDAAMAEAMAAAAGTPGTDAAALVTGSGHARSDRGVPLHLRRIAPGARILTVAPVEVEPGKTTPESYRRFFGDGPLPFDIVWFTPKVDDVDHCAGLAEKFRNRK
jgi:uncharacterized iron-regulated protein